MNGIPEDKYSVCPDTGLNVCEIFDGVWVREDGMFKRDKNSQTKGWFTGYSYTRKDCRKKNPLFRTWFRIMINKKLYQVHRLIAKAFISNYSVDLVVDHINGNTLDNRLTNLRCVTNRENTLNQYKHRNGKLAGACLIGVGRYLSNCSINGKTHHIGIFPTEQEAHDAYVKCRQEYGLS